MKVLRFLSAVALASFFSSAASAEVGRFDGGGVIYDFSNACLNAGWPGGTEPVYARFHPNGVGTNGNRESISFSGFTNSFSFARYDGSFSSSWQSVATGAIFARPQYYNQGQEGAAEIRILSMYPRTLSDTTAGPVRLRGMIRHLGGVRWCRVNFDVVVQQEP